MKTNLRLTAWAVVLKKLLPPGPSFLSTIEIDQIIGTNLEVFMENRTDHGKLQRKINADHRSVYTHDVSSKKWDQRRT